MSLSSVAGCFLFVSHGTRNVSGCHFGAQNDDEDVTFSSLWDVATYTGQSRSLLNTIASIYPAVGAKSTLLAGDDLTGHSVFGRRDSWRSKHLSGDAAVRAGA